MSVRKQKPALSTEHRLTKLEEETKTIFVHLQELAKSTGDDIAEIKSYVSNHIMHSLEKTNADLKVLLERKQSYDAVKDFLHKCVQVSVSLAALIWTCAQIMMIWKNIH